MERAIERKIERATERLKYIYWHLPHGIIRLVALACVICSFAAMYFVSYLAAIVIAIVGLILVLFEIPVEIKYHQTVRIMLKILDDDTSYTDMYGQES